ncbi:RIP-like protein [Drosophila grimshawi]|uniref:GH10650 n=1 Tax=Drosophila grimshawi TaxID=7222 RepID=B4JCJ7_DROGR|nr:RIP-like protein [Drosophila grimshawi]EDW03151.1 GH10650 [Drosophila grimshawi]
MQSPSSVVYNTSVEQKRHAQEVAKRQRLGAPKLRELLREKCRIRIINARKDNVDGNRKMQLSELEQILRMELNELDQDLELEQHVYEELLSDVNEWYALQEQHLEALYAEPDDDAKELSLLCPVCLMKSLQRIKSQYSCECGVRFEHAADKPQLQQLIQQKINEHELNCTQALVFFIEEQSVSRCLFAICGSCDYCCSV